MTDPSGMQGVPIDDEDEVDPYWEGGGRAGGAGGGGSMSAREFFTRAWNAIFSTTKFTPGGAGASPAATPNRSENPDLLPAASSKPTAIPENYPGTRSSSSARATSTSSAAKTVPANRLHHIFGKSEHALESLVKKFGSQEAAFNAVQNAANQALKAGKLTPDANGILPKVGGILDVDGINVRLIGGKVENSKVIISSFSRKDL